MSGNAVNKLLKEIKKYVKQNSVLLVACSGGADSAALTDALWQLKNECSYKITVMHVEHGIRGQEALDDAEFVKNFCAERGAGICMQACKSTGLCAAKRAFAGGRSTPFEV